MNSVFASLRRVRGARSSLFVLTALSLLLTALSLFRCVHAEDVFHLKSGGRVAGELVNRDQSPRTTYVIRVGKDQLVTLDPDQVEEAQIETEQERQYKRLLPKMPATAEGHWKMSQWCRQKLLSDQEQFHLEKVIELEPDHELARRRLGFSQIDGRWIIPEDHQRAQGYERYRGRWRVHQDIELIKQREKQELAEKEWTKKIRMWRSWLEGRRSEAAQKQLLSIQDEAAVPALAELLPDERDRRIRSLYIQILGQIDNPSATVALVNSALNDRDEETRLLCIDQLERPGHAQAAGMFIRELQSRENRHLNRAAVALGRLNDTSAVPSLIDVLTTQHKMTVGPPPGQLGAAFGRDGRGAGTGGLSVGGRPKVVERTVQNRYVLDALIALTDGVNFQYDKAQVGS